ncbi:hypothetical protein L2Y96_20335 [Luteibacter aegosomaticola]|uniref:hypothetical protein n=1 Tax=Luteibacter aegosomaticola TaxID=2911538 RepID=UPI001FFA3E85|nr:hypothetical protein [Luteibacter aegosomaticola]UPG89709.1 hypothetical protein L2Y96_20335 [Luteibacter aegosomaticola]
MLDDNDMFSPSTADDHDQHRGGGWQRYVADDPLDARFFAYRKLKDWWDNRSIDKQIQQE